MIKRIAIICIVLAAVCVVTMPVMAEERGATLLPAMVEEAAKDASISADQMKSIMGFWYTNQKEIVKIKAELEIKGIDLQSAMEADATQPRIIMDLVKQMGDLRTKMDMAEMAFSLKVMEVLRPEQARKVRDIMRKKSLGTPGDSGGEGGHQ